ncbi:MAG: helix-turn-helix transcriptional regulator [Oscillospiraceae bacterium]|nr:helix-turn-helix transcriptional regulator [Oscillospiraceae bacterium]
MAVSYKKLWVLLAEKELKRTELKGLSGISSNTLAKLGKNETVSMEALQKICKVLKCNIGDIVDYVPGEES